MGEKQKDNWILQYDINQSIARNASLKGDQVSYSTTIRVSNIKDIWTRPSLGTINRIANFLKLNRPWLKDENIRFNYDTPGYTMEFTFKDLSKDIEKEYRSQDSIYRWGK